MQFELLLQIGSVSFAGSTGISLCDVSMLLGALAHATLQSCTDAFESWSQLFWLHLGKFEDYRAAWAAPRSTLCLQSADKLAF